MTQLTHATIETFPTPGGAIRFFAGEGLTHENFDGFEKGFAICWVDSKSIEVKAVSEPWTPLMFRLAIKAAGRAGAERIGFVRVRKDGSKHTKWYRTK